MIGDDSRTACTVLLLLALFSRRCSPEAIEGICKEPLSQKAIFRSHTRLPFSQGTPSELKFSPLKYSGKRSSPTSQTFNLNHKTFSPSFKGPQSSNKLVIQLGGLHKTQNTQNKSLVSSAAIPRSRVPCISIQKLRPPHFHVVSDQL